MSNPMDFGDVHSVEALMFTVRKCLDLKDIDGMLLSFVYGDEMARMLGKEITEPDKLLNLFENLSCESGKPIGLSFFGERRHIEQLKALNTFPVFSDPEESAFAFKMLWEYTRRRRNQQSR